MFNDRLINRFFESQIVKFIIAYSCVFTGISVFFTVTTFNLHSFGLLSNSIDYVPFSNYLGIGLLHLIPYGFLLYKFKFCSWSKESWKMIVLYSLGCEVIYMFDLINIKWLMIVINLVMFKYIIFVIINLLKTRFRCCEI